MMDQYKEQYKKETEQIHAPADLIAKTKAAMREEEMRMQRESAAQTVRTGAQEISAVPKKPSLGMTARKWTYPLTAVAAILVLVSVSMMMRGLDKTSSGSPMYEMAEGDNGAEESASETAAAEAAPEESFALEEAMEEQEAGAVFDAGMDSAGSVADDMERTSGASARSEVTESADEEKSAAASDGAAEAEELRDAMSQKKEEAAADLAVPVENVTIKKVRNKPVFVDRADTESRTYEDVVFRIIKEGDEWVAYVESESGGGYVIRGEAESIEAFLEAGYQKLSEKNY